jgi:hypothetical protein
MLEKGCRQGQALFFAYVRTVTPFDRFMQFLAVMVRVQVWSLKGLV